MSFCDVFPRICLVLFLPSGLTLIGLHPLGQETFGGWKLLPIWILGLAWLALVVYEYRSLGAGAHVKLLQNIDLTIRIVLVTGLLAAGIAALTVPDRFGVEQPALARRQGGPLRHRDPVRRHDPGAPQALRRGLGQARHRRQLAGDRGRHHPRHPPLRAVRLRHLVLRAQRGVPRHRQARCHRLLTPPSARSAARLPLAASASAAARSASPLAALRLRGPPVSLLHAENPRAAPDTRGPPRVDRRVSAAPRGDPARCP